MVDSLTTVFEYGGTILGTLSGLGMIWISAWYIQWGWKKGGTRHKRITSLIGICMGVVGGGLTYSGFWVTYNMLPFSFTETISGFVNVVVAFSIFGFVLWTNQRNIMYARSEA